MVDSLYGQFVVSQYQDDLGKLWYVKIRRKTYYLGDFGNLTFKQQTDALNGHVDFYPWKQRSMRYVSIKLEVGSIIYVPQSRTNTYNMLHVGSVIDVPTNDRAVEGVIGGVGWTVGLILNRFGERPGRTVIDENGAFGFPA